MSKEDIKYSTTDMHEVLLYHLEQINEDIYSTYFFSEIIAAMKYFKMFDGFKKS